MFRALIARVCAIFTSMRTEPFYLPGGEIDVKDARSDAHVHRIQGVVERMNHKIGESGHLWRMAEQIVSVILACYPDLRFIQGGCNDTPTYSCMTMLFMLPATSNYRTDHHNYEKFNSKDIRIDLMYDVKSNTYTYIFAVKNVFPDDVAKDGERKMQGDFNGFEEFRTTFYKKLGEFVWLP